MRRLVMKWIVWIILTSALTSCWDMRYLDHIGIVMGIGIDQGVKNPEHLLVSLQIANPKGIGGLGKGGSNKTAAVLITGEGKSLSDAIDQASRRTPREPWFSQNQILIIGEELARKDITLLFDLIDRDPELRSDFEVMIAKNSTANQILQFMSTLEDIPAQMIEKMSHTNSHSTGHAVKITAKDFIQRIQTDGIDPTAGGLLIEGSPEKAAKKEMTESILQEATLKTNGMAVFREGKLVDFLSEEASRGFAWVMGENTRGVTVLPCGEETYNSLRINKTRKRLFAQMKEGRPQLFIEVHVQASLLEVGCPETKLDERKTSESLEKLLQEKIHGEVEEAVAATKRLNTDPFGFGKTVKAASYSYWKEHKEDWNALLPQVPVEIDVHTTISNTGTKNKSFLEGE